MNPPERQRDLWGTIISTIFYCFDITYRKHKMECSSSPFCALPFYCLTLCTVRLWLRQAAVEHPAYQNAQGEVRKSIQKFRAQAFTFLLM